MEKSYQTNAGKKNVQVSAPVIAGMPYNVYCTLTHQHVK